jgi:alkanesulfonate monooxygenase SsuD/methylene tetrahydromethanopterin reductase-like flavin-dependent oxidoreductase (luciferase family)
MQVHMFHLMPWQKLPQEYMTDVEKYPAAWVTYPNTFFEPEAGADLYNTYLDQLEYAETLGFDGVCVNEHHQNHYGLMPAPNIIAALLARRTRRVKIILLGNALPLRDHPQRVAEEVAMLDVVTRGRIVSGFVRGIGPEHYSFDINPAVSRERFQEAHDLIIQAWTRPGPFSFYGKHYKFRYVNVTPRPYTKPHPEVWIPTLGSSETVDFAAERRYPYLMLYLARARMAQALAEYTRAAEDKFGYTPPPEQKGWGTPIYLAETEAEAHAQAEPHILWLFHHGLRMPGSMLSPPGYTSPANIARYVKAGKTGFREVTYKKLLDDEWMFVGTPATVRERLVRHASELGVGHLVVLLQFGSMPDHLARRNMELFAREVLPALKPLNVNGAMVAAR